MPSAACQHLGCCLNGSTRRIWTVLCQVVFSENVQLMNWVSIGMIAFYSVITVLARPFSEHFSLVCDAQRRVSKGSDEFRNVPIGAFRQPSD
jgi:hypothetical protein